MRVGVALPLLSLLTGQKPELKWTSLSKTERVKEEADRKECEGVV